MLNRNAQGLRLVDKAHATDTRRTVSRRGGTRDAGTVARSMAPIAPVDSDALARAIAEIETASAALRQSEPALEPWRPNSESERRYLPVWILIGAVWIAALLGLSGATGAILYLAG